MQPAIFRRSARRRVNRDPRDKPGGCVGLEKRRPKIPTFQPASREPSWTAVPLHAHATSSSPATKINADNAAPDHENVTLNHALPATASKPPMIAGILR
jgi:hypothetical protein